MTGQAEVDDVDDVVRVELDSIEDWTAMCGAAYVPHRAVASGPFRGALVERTLGDLGVTHVGSTRLSVTRPRRLAAGEPRDVFMFAAFIRGGGATRQGERTARVPGGGGYFIDGDRPYELRLRHRYEMLVARLPRTHTRLPDRALRATTSVAVSPGSRGVGPLTRHLAGLVGRRRSFGAEAAEGQQRLVGELVRGVLYPMVYPEGSRPLLSGAATAAHARWFIEEHRRDPSLTIDDVARELRVDRRYLEMVFSREGVGPAGYLRRARLLDARRVLLDQPRLPVGEVGLQVGFLSANSFIRAFGREVGVTPLQWRRARRGDAAAGPAPLLTDLSAYDWTAAPPTG
ncbi:helix-turn-helix domain-containing protein [Pimelobacter simplex]|uniref:helix-turn-helix domain-containing protein n=1 Tax=Nocardioides simplex TaxID=2045 RepID=UPI0021505CB2|nr:AraC family transcriptional regulator [Pimelobacter simplex]UUW90586.1 AraC family transcriptional regulator [Pimelobacter simplex]UUW94417.1 AraC family transcriptional regulator [Pimelobacter simplex]